MTKTMNQLYMMKNNIRYRVSFGVILSLFFTLSCFSQKNQNTELKIKTSGNYIWSQVIDADTLIGKKNAKEQAIIEFNKNKDALNLGAKLKENIGYFIKSRGNKYMIVAYINKTARKTNMEQNNELNKPNISNIEEERTNKISKPKDSKQENNFKVEQKVTEEINNKKEKKEPTSINTRKENKIENKIEAKPVKYVSESDLLNKLNNTNSCYELFKILEQQKMRGKVVFSQRSNAFDNLSNCYIVVCDNASNKVRMILDKGTEQRINIVNSKKVTKQELSNQKLKKIYIYEF